MRGYLSETPESSEREDHDESGLVNLVVLLLGKRVVLDVDSRVVSTDVDVLLSSDVCVVLDSSDVEVGVDVASGAD